MHMQDTKIVVAAHLEERRGFYHMLFSWKGIDGKRGRMSKTTGLPIERNFELATAMMEEQRLALEAEFEAKGQVRKAPVQAAPKDNTPQKSGVYAPNVTGHLELSKGVYRMRIRWTNPDGTKGRKMISTGVADKRGNRRRADGVLDATCEEIENDLLALAEELSRQKELKKEDEAGNVFFADFLNQWLEYKSKDQPNEKRISEVTWSGYVMIVQRVLEPYFRQHDLRVADITADVVSMFYKLRRETVKGTTILHDHAVITGALKYAGKLGLLTSICIAKFQDLKKKRMRRHSCVRMK